MNAKNKTKQKKSRMGFNPAEWKTEGVGEGKKGVLPKKDAPIVENLPSEISKPKPQNDAKIKKTAPQEKLVQVSVYLTKHQYKALKMKIALSDRAEDKDQSAIMRSALDAYLSDILQKK